MGDYSKDATVVEYTVQSMMKGKSPRAAARATAKKFEGTQNLFIGSADTIHIDPDALEGALWERLVGFATANIPKMKAGKEHFVLLGTLQYFKQKPSMRAELKQQIIRSLGADPFTSDDGS